MSTRFACLLALLGACSTPAEPKQEPVAAPIAVASPVPAPHGFRTKLIRTLPPYMRYWPVQHIENVGDWDGDGITDLAVSNEESRGEPWGAAGVQIFSSRDGRSLAKLPGLSEIVRSPHMSRWEARFAGIGDIDADGRADVALLSSGFRADATTIAVLWALGSAGKEPIWKQDIAVPRECMPFTLQRLGDLDRDGIRDIGIGIPPCGGPNPPEWTDAAGYVEARSGKDGKFLWRVRGEIGMRTGWQLARHADANGDGTEDVATLVVARDPGDSGLASDDPQPRVEVRSGTTGAIVRSIPNVVDPSWTMRQSMVPYQLVGGEDIDGDGVMDLTMRTLRAGDPEFLDVISGRDGSTLARMSAHPDLKGREDGWFPSAVAIGSDLDGDGWRDLLLGHDEVGTEQGYDCGAIYVHSTRTNERLAAAWGTMDDSKLGDAIAWLGDTDGDGTPEFAALTTRGVRIWAIEPDAPK